MRKVNDEKTRIRSKGRAVNNTGSVRQRANGTWEGRVVTGVDPATGKTIRRSVYGDKEKDVRRIAEDTVRTAGAILFMYTGLFLSAGIAVSLIESLPLMACLFETGSALGTAGLTLGITAGLSLPSHIILMLLMFAGRVGGLTLIYAAFATGGETARLPMEKITVG